MLQALAQNKGSILICGTSADARALKPEELAEGARRNTLDELIENMLSGDKVLVFQSRFPAPLDYPIAPRMARSPRSVKTSWR